MNPTPNSFFAAKRAALAGHRRGVIDADAVQFLIHMAIHASAPYHKAARRVVGECECGHVMSSIQLKRTAFPNGRLTFQPGVENVNGRILVTIMRSATLGTFPTPHSQPFLTLWATPRRARRTGYGRKSFVGFNVSRSVPAGLIGELRPQHRPACVQDGFGHSGFRKFGRADVADNDQSVVASNPGGPLVEVMLACISDLRVDRLHASFVSRALRRAERGLIFSIVPNGRNFRTVTECGKFFKTKIDTNSAGTSRSVVRDFADKTNIPTPARILDKRSGLERAIDLAVLPKTDSALEVNRRAAINLHSSRDKWDPSKRPLWATTCTESGAAFLGVTRDSKLAANCSNRIGVDPQVSGGASAKSNQVECTEPTRVTLSKLPIRLRFSLGLAAKIPDKITRAGLPNKMLPGRRIFDPVFESQKLGAISLFSHGDLVHRSLGSERSRHSNCRGRSRSEYTPFPLHSNQGPRFLRALKG